MKRRIKFLKGTICLAVSLCLALSSIPVLAEEELPGAAMDIEVSESSDNSDTLAEDETVETEDSLTEEFMGEDIEPSETLPEIEISSEKASHAADAVMTAEKTAALSILCRLYRKYFLRAGDYFYSECFRRFRQL